jgi:hypothetical protein
LDAYFSKTEINYDSYNSEDQRIVDALTDLYDIKYRYVLYEKSSDKQSAMDEFVLASSDVERLLK